MKWHKLFRQFPSFCTMRPPTNWRWSATSTQHSKIVKLRVVSMQLLYMHLASWDRHPQAQITDGMPEFVLLENVPGHWLPNNGNLSLSVCKPIIFLHSYYEGREHTSLAFISGPLRQHKHPRPGNKAEFVGPPAKFATPLPLLGKTWQIHLFSCTWRS